MCASCVFSKAKKNSTNLEQFDSFNYSTFIPHPYKDSLSLYTHTESLEMATPPVNVSEAIQVRILRIYPWCISISPRAAFCFLMMGQLIDPIGCRPLRLFDHLFFCKDYSFSALLGRWSRGWRWSHFRFVCVRSTDVLLFFPRVLCILA